MTYTTVPVYYACALSHRAHVTDCLTLCMLRLFSLTRRHCYDYLVIRHITDTA